MAEDRSRPARLSRGRLLSAFVGLFGMVCCLIALTHIAIGPAAIPGSVPGNATMDSEDRFYATLFLGYGAALLWCARDLQHRVRPLGWLLLLFALGGLSRLVSVVMVGPPNLLFQMLAAVELLLPPIVWFWTKRTWPDVPQTPAV